MGLADECGGPADGGRALHRLYQAQLGGRQVSGTARGHPALCKQRQSRRKWGENKLIFLSNSTTCTPQLDKSTSVVRSEQFDRQQQVEQRLRDEATDVFVSYCWTNSVMASSVCVFVFLFVCLFVCVCVCVCVCVSHC